LLLLLLLCASALWVPTSDYTVSTGILVPDSTATPDVTDQKSRDVPGRIRDVDTVMRDTRRRARA
jgi:hypothetical protein